MSRDITIEFVHNETNEALIVRFSDGTYAGFMVEELLALRPRRELRDPQAEDPRRFIHMTTVKAR
jgi:hypothetical protein